MASPNSFPQTEANDPDSVADALDLGLLRWAKGETVEALQCLQQAREAAEAAGNEPRAQALAKAAAELASRQSAKPEPALKSQDVPAEPRRSRLPEPPAPVKKFANTGESEVASATRGAASKTSVAPNSAKSFAPPTSSGSSFRSQGNAETSPTSTLASARPAPPSTRPSASAAPVATASKIPQPAAVQGQTGTAVATGVPRSTTAAQSAASQPARAESIAAQGDHRLASVRVRIERVDPDGSIQLKLLDLAATASGEDNAILVVQQSLWQNLKRGS
jgi:hypothetical protein